MLIPLVASVAMLVNPIMTDVQPAGGDAPAKPAVAAKNSVVVSTSSINRRTAKERNLAARPVLDSEWC